MNNGWKETTLGEVIYPVSDTFDFAGINEVHFLNTGDILDGKLLHNNLMSVEQLPGQAKKSFKEGDILYSEIRPANKRYMLVDFDSSNSVASTKLMVLRNRDIINSKYIYQILTAEDTLKEFQFIAESRSGTFPQITFDAISTFPILLPPLPEQKAIAAILSSFDDKIELMRRQNKTLESIAEIIFRKLFIEDAGDRWKASTLSEHTIVLRGLSYKGDGLADESSGIPMHNLNSIYEGGGYKYEGIKVTVHGF